MEEKIMRYYISDLHFYHKNLISRMDNRPFDTVEEMNEYMIKQWNKKVRKNDEVIVIGDLSFGDGEQTNEILKQLNGTIYLIEGNHDHKFLKDPKFQKERLKWIKPYVELNDNKRKVVISHYPIFCYNGQYRKDQDGNPSTFMLYGHVHQTKDYELVKQFIKITKETKTLSAHQTEPTNIPCQMINCFCMLSDYTPLTLDEWIEKNKEEE
jgi:calcineurin-like phosphoesterase family protein